jgi:protein involved in polysaccharide export with SLBB domain
MANISVRYGQAHYAGTWQVETTSLGEARYRLDAETTEPIETCLADEADAFVLAHRLQLIGSNLPIEIEIEDGPLLLTYSPGDKIRIQRDRGPSLTGSFDQPMEIERISKSIADVAVQATVSNMRGLGPVVKRAAPDGTPDWASASDDDTMQYAYATDDNGFVVTGDGTTFRQAVPW